MKEKRKESSKYTLQQHHNINKHNIYIYFIPLTFSLLSCLYANLHLVLTKAHYASKGHIYNFHERPKVKAQCFGGV